MEIHGPVLQYKLGTADVNDKPPYLPGVAASGLMWDYWFVSTSSCSLCWVFHYVQQLDKNIDLWLYPQNE